jgi:hypothetical protein
MPSEIPPQQIKAVAGQVLKSWWFWLGLAVVTWSGFFLLEKLTAFDSGRFEGRLAQSSSNQIAASLSMISNGIAQEIERTASNQFAQGFGMISNRIVAGMSQPQIQAAIAAVAADKANDAMLRAISPALSNFQARVEQAESSFNSTTGRLGRLARDAESQSALGLPTGILFDSQTVTRQGSSCLLTVFFKKTGASPLGLLRLSIGAFNKLPARILRVDVASETDRDTIERSVDPTGLEAVLGFTPAGGSGPAIQIALTGPTVIQIVCDALPEPLTVPVLVDLSSPAAGGQ